MRMIVEAFTETLDLGLAKPNQIVVRLLRWLLLLNRRGSPPTVFRRYIGLFGMSIWRVRHFHFPGFCLRRESYDATNTEMLIADDPYVGLWLAYRKGDGRLPVTGLGCVKYLPTQVPYDWPLH